MLGSITSPRKQKRACGFREYHVDTHIPTEAKAVKRAGLMGSHSLSPSLFSPLLQLPVLALALLHCTQTVKNQAIKQRITTPSSSNSTPKCSPRGTGSST